jgi:polysaccharide biosynthesis transport protein
MTDLPAHTQRSQLDRGIHALRRLWWVVVICVLIGGAATGARAQKKTNDYQATATLLFNFGDLGQALFGYGSSTGDPDRTAATNLSLVTQRDVAAATAKELGGDYSADEVSGAVSAAQAGATNLVDVTATSGDEQRAERIANAYADEFVAYSIDHSRDTILAARKRLQRQIDTAQDDESISSNDIKTLQNRVGQLTALASVQTGGVSVINRASDGVATTSRSVRGAVIIGGLLGLIVGLVAVALLALIDRRARDPEDVEEVTGWKTLGVFPKSRRLSGPLGPLDPADSGAFGLLHARLRYSARGRDLRLLVVTASSAGEGASTIAWHLAHAAADSRVLILEADLRAATGYADRAGLRAAPGLTDVLRGTASIADVIQPSPGSGETLGGSGVFAITAGSPVQDLARLLASRAMSNLLGDLRGQFDLVVIDVTSPTTAPDAFPLIGQADGVLVVTRLRHARKDGLRLLADELSSSRVAVLGVAVNGAGRGVGRPAPVRALGGPDVPEAEQRPAEALQGQ